MPGSGRPSTGQWRRRLPTKGLIAYVERRPLAAHDGVPGACGSSTHPEARPPRRLGCSGDGVIPEQFNGLSWSRSGNLLVHDVAVWPPVVLRVSAGRPLPGATPALERMAGRRKDGTRVHLSERSEDAAEISVTSPTGRERRIVSIDGPDSYWFAEPQWSPDGRWILLSDIKGRLLIVDERGKDIRELLPANPRREWVSAPFLTWHQGE